MIIRRDDNLLALLESYGYSDIDINKSEILISSDNKNDHEIRLVHNTYISFNSGNDIHIKDMTNLNKYINETGIWNINFDYHIKGGVLHYDFEKASKNN